MKQEDWLERGAHCVAGSVIYKGVEVAVLRNGEMQMTAQGRNVADQLGDAPAKPTRTRKKAPAVEQAVTAPDEVNLPMDIDDLMGV